MRDINECKAEIFRRSKLELSKRKKRRNQMISYCIPLFFCVIALVFINLPRDNGAMTENTDGDIGDNSYKTENPATNTMGTASSTEENAEGSFPEADIENNNDESEIYSYEGTSSSNSAPSNETLDETILEFSITQNVENYDWSEHTEILGWFGARQFLGKKYELECEEDNIMPEHYVTYLVSAYPDHADGGEYITEIRITDPTVNVYGLTTRSSVEDFDRVFSSFGYTLFDGGTEAYPQRVATKNGISYMITKQTENDDITPEIIISAKVTNREGIIY